jgi:O-antigen/teichoic acid export membrane protein
VLASLLFGDSGYVYLIMPLYLCVAGLLLQTMVYSYYRGYLRMLMANFFQLMTIALVPVVVFKLSTASGAYVLSLTGVCWILVSSAFAIPLLLKTYVSVSHLKVAYFRDIFKELFRFGIVRVPGDLAYTGLFSLPPIFAAHSRGLQEAGSISFALSMLNLCASVTGPIGLVMLPVASRMAAKGELEVLRKFLIKVAFVCISVTSVAVVIFEIFAVDIVRVYLGAQYVSMAGTVRIVLIAAVPLVAALVLRNPLDAVLVKPLNSKNYIIAFGTLVVLLAFGGMVCSAPLATGLSFLVLGILTVYDGNRVIRPQQCAANSPVL